MHHDTTDRTADPATDPPADHAARRRFLRGGALGALGALAPLPLLGAQAQAAPASGARWLALAHTHTGERLEIAYADSAGYRAGAIEQLNRFLRDHYSDEVGTMDPRLFDAMERLRTQLGTSAGFEIVSAYRCPATNERLRRTRGGGVAPNSLHLQGRAIDLRLPGVALTALRDAAWALGAGGVGCYLREGFVHIDTGRVRRW